MKVLGVKLTQSSATYRPVVSLSYDNSQKKLQVTAKIYTAATSDPEEITANIDIAKLQSGYDWSDHQCYVLPTNNVSFSPTVCLYAETLPQRQTSIEYGISIQKNMLVGVNVPFAGASDEELVVTVTVGPSAQNADITVSGDLSLGWQSASTMEEVRSQILPSITVTAPATIQADGSAVLQAQIQAPSGVQLPANTTIYVEAVSGYAPQTRVVAVNGSASIPVYATGLSSGNTMRVKLGWKFFPGVANAIMTVA